MIFEDLSTALIDQYAEQSLAQQVWSSKDAVPLARGRVILENAGDKKVNFDGIFIEAVSNVFLPMIYPSYPASP